MSEIRKSDIEPMIRDLEYQADDLTAEASKLANAADVARRIAPGETYTAVRDTVAALHRIAGDVRYAASRLRSL